MSSSSSSIASTFDVKDLFRVDGMVAVITGGGTGIGLHIAKALAANGAAKVYIVGRRKEKLEEAAKSSEFNNIVPIQGDVTSKESLQAVAKQVQDEVGFVNLLVANSGSGGPGFAKLSPDATLSEFRDYLWDIPMEDCNETFAVNVTGVLYTIAAFLELLDEGNKKANLTQQSQVIATSSIGGFLRPNATDFPYQTSKAAVTHMMKMMATCCGKYQIRHNTLLPGLFLSEMATPLLPPGDTTIRGSLPFKVLSAGRAGTEQEMGATILYMASKAGAYCDGSMMVIDGGRMGTIPSTY